MELDRSQSRSLNIQESKTRGPMERPSHHFSRGDEDGMFHLSLKSTARSSTSVWLSIHVSPCLVSAAHPAYWLHPHLLHPHLLHPHPLHPHLLHPHLLHPHLLHPHPLHSLTTRYRLMEDRLVAVERQMLDLARELRAAPPGSVLAVAHLTAGAAPSSLETAAAASVGGTASADGAGKHSKSAPAPLQSGPSASASAAAPATKQLHGKAIVWASTTAAASSTGQQAAGDLLSGGGSIQEGKARLFEINRIQAAITEVVNSGYLESVKGLRETLLVQEWGLQAKNWAQRRGVSAFEQWCAEHAAAEVSYETISALYNDPDALHLLPTPRLRMMARAMIEHHTLQAYEEVFIRCTTTAEGLARVGLADLLPHTAGVGQVLRGLLPGGLPFMGAGFWKKGLRWLMPFSGGGGN
ncbi:hypothetical protein Vafri_15366 [Volvox africanus]|uniref:Uncharacterized protein n=1 Tax=Volvox africanus TaxID=51714 RepID=A0A8J4BF91_9CHLO|nr:hypothetical protein Vafri_15366 [Volvox africanus]